MRAKTKKANDGTQKEGLHRIRPRGRCRRGREALGGPSKGRGEAASQTSEERQLAAPA
jgi:hypothetical protein